MGHVRAVGHSDTHGGDPLFRALIIDGEAAIAHLRELAVQARQLGFVISGAVCVDLLTRHLGEQRLAPGGSVCWHRLSDAVADPQGVSTFDSAHEARFSTDNHDQIGRFPHTPGQVLQMRRGHAAQEREWGR